MTGRAKALAASIAAAAAIAASGCSGHGKYTQEGISLAKQRLDSLKAATEYDMARQAFLAGDLDKALKKSDAALLLAENNPRIHVLRGRIHIERGNVGRALLSLRRALELDENAIDARYYLGVVHERLNEPEEALAHFRAAAELEGYNPQYPIAAGEMLVDLGRLDEAKTFLTDSEAADHSAGVQQLLGHIALIEGRPADACELFTKARLLAPEDGAILEDLATAQIAAGRFADAETNLSGLLKDPENEGRRDLLHMRGECLMALGRPVEAREIYRTLSEDDGASDPQAWVGRGRAAYAVGDARNLRRAASRVVATDPAEPDGYILWALWHRDAGEPNLALEKLDAGLMRSGRDAELLGVRALVLMELGRHAAAATAARSALELDPSNRACRTLLDQLDAVASVPTD